MQLTGEAEAARRQAIGLAEAKATEALGLARATGFEAQKEALGGPATAVVAVANAVADGHITVVPEVLVTGGGGSFEGLAATLMRTFTSGSGPKPPPIVSTPVEAARLDYDESEGELGTERSDQEAGIPRPRSTPPTATATADHPLTRTGVTRPRPSRVRRRRLRDAAGLGGGEAGDEAFGVFDGGAQHSDSERDGTHPRPGPEGELDADHA